MDAATAKQFLIRRVIEEAQAEHVSLSEAEKKMLYFTEAQPTKADMATEIAEFERSNDSDEYEDKIVDLLKRARTRDLQQSVSSRSMWTDAISALKHEDHYILVMVYGAFPEHRDSILPTHRVRDYMIYIAIGIAVVIAMVVLKWKH